MTSFFEHPKFSDEITSFFEHPKILRENRSYVQSWVKYP